MADEDAEALRPVGQVEHNGKGKRGRCGGLGWSFMLLAVQSYTDACVVSNNSKGPEMCQRSLMGMAKLGVEVTPCTTGRWAVLVCGVWLA